MRAVSRGLKRALDLTVAVPASVLGAPVVIALALGSAVAYRAWPFFIQSRVGRGGQPFRCVKIRTLPAHAPRDADRHTIDAHIVGRWGRVLRETHLDELPELWHVIAGSMSLVGPRPVIPEHSASFDSEFVGRRTVIRPGVTGLWQLNAAQPIGDHPEFDLHYLDHRTLRLDVWIIGRTLRRCIGRGRPLALDDIPRWTGARPR